jgi:hypothetical protein
MFAPRTLYGPVPLGSPLRGNRRGATHYTIAASRYGIMKIRTNCLRRKEIHTERNVIYMHIPSERIYNEMRAEEFSLWCVPANGDDEVAVLIKTPTSSIKALVSGCPMEVLFGIKEHYLCIGVQITDMPDTPVFICKIERHSEEHDTLMHILDRRIFPLFLFNEMDICLAWTNVELSQPNAKAVLDFLGQVKNFYVGPYVNETSHVLDCFTHSVDERNTFPNVQIIPTCKIDTILEKWRIIDNYFFSAHESHCITIDEENEGEIFERAIWASLESVFPLTLYKSPQVKIGEKMRELTDVFSFYPGGSFLIEAKDLSVINAGYHRDQPRRIAGIQKQVKKAITQLVGASKAFMRGKLIYDAKDNELNVFRKIPPHCIVLITELIYSGDRKDIETQLMEAMKQTGAIFHLLDLNEFITLLKCSSGNPEVIDHNLLERAKLFFTTQSIFIRGQPSML